MTFGELCKWVDSNRKAIHPKAVIGVRDYYGHLEDTLEGLEWVPDPKGWYIALVGVSSMYPEPD